MQSTRISRGKSVFVKRFESPLGITDEVNQLIRDTALEITTDRKLQKTFLN